MELIHRNSRFLALVPSSYGAYSGAQSVVNALNEHLCEPPPGGRRCELFVWNSHKGDEATSHITSYSYDPTRTDAKDSSVSELFFQALRAREYPDDGQEVIDYPFPGLVNSAQTSDEFHDNQICISVRVPARDERETDSELNVLGNTGFTSHFPFIVPPSDNELKIEGNTRLDTASTTRETMLQEAAEQLATQFDRSPKKMSGTKNTTVVRPADISNPI
ncbi:hypothetical protein G6011_06818 [Alternaria panax]|uniref:Uncharacterized protein n=1 Tax=Alternaria panax TaxID=48097 RepID=A0AAD4FIF3_9PLEO|nr:hypothetical protein G6011_06818 [Alternaria panax]